MKTSYTNIASTKVPEIFPHLRIIKGGGGSAIILVTGKTSIGKYIGTVLHDDQTPDCNNVGVNQDWVLKSEPYYGSVTLHG